MAQQQHAADVHPDELCPPNKRYDLMDANKKVDLEHVQCPSESKILMNIIKNHPLRFSIAASASVPWIYMAQFWHTLKEDGSKHRLKFLLDRKELTLTLDDFRTIFHLPQANDNNHASFVPPPSFSDMVPFYKQVLGFTMELKTVSNFKISGLLQPWQTLCKIFSKCLTTRVTGWDQPPLQIMQMLYCFVNNIHVDYAELMWEGIYYSLHHPATSIPYPRFTKIIISHYMTIFPDISRRARDAYHNLQDDDIMKNIFNSGRNKNKVGMRIPAWMITDEMKLTEHYKMYAEVFGLDVPLTQSQPTESTQGTYRTPSAPRSPNPATETAESSVPKRLTVILLLSTRVIKKLVEDPKNVDDSSPPRHDDTSIPGRLEPRSNKESLEVEIVQEKEEETTKDTEVEPDKDTPMVDVTNIVTPVNVDDKEDEIIDEIESTREVEEVPCHKSRSSSLFQNNNSQLYLAMMAVPLLQHQDIAILDDPHDDAHPERRIVVKKHEDIGIKYFLQSDIVWESRKENLVSPHPRKITPLVLKLVKEDPGSSTLSVINQGPFVLEEKEIQVLEKIILSLHKISKHYLNDDDMKKNQGHYRSEYLKLKNQNHRNQAGSGEARGRVYALGGGEADQSPINVEDEANA
ncbi:hypothetical protein Tco_1177557 [Tanacetum coccineum]